MRARLVAVCAVLGMLAPVCATSTARAQTDESKLRVIEVSGSGEARAAADFAILNLAIETHAATAQQCASDNAALAAKVVDTLRNKLGDKGKVSTGAYSLYPEYSEEQGRRNPQIVGYRAENSVTVETGAIDLLGQLIDAAVAAGANRVNFLNFSLKNDYAARNEAIAKASSDAQKRAQSLAASLGVKLKRVIKASTVEEVRPLHVAMPMTLGAAAPSAPTPIQPGEVTVPATVSLVYEIE